MLRQNGIEDLVERLERDGSHRVLRRLDVRAGRTGVDYDGGGSSIGVVVDVETTGTDTASDVVIEFAMRRFRFDGLGRILKIDRAWSWREDPGRALDDEIVRLTGITDADLVGQEIDEDAAGRLLASADLVIAHNAGFDRRFVERRLPGSAGRAWGCSCREIDWATAGFDGRALGWLPQGEAIDVVERAPALGGVEQGSRVLVEEALELLVGSVARVGRAPQLSARLPLLSYDRPEAEGSRLLVVDRGSPTGDECSLGLLVPKRSAVGLTDAALAASARAACASVDGRWGSTCCAPDGVGRGTMLRKELNVASTGRCWKCSRRTMRPTLE